MGSVEIQSLMKWLDLRLAQALARAGEVLEADAAADPFRGMHLSLPDLLGQIARRPAEPLFAPLHAEDTGIALPGLPDADSRLGWLARAYHLDGFDLGVLAIALAREVDLRYGRLFAYLQDDVSRRAPTLDLALNLLCSQVEDKLSYRAAFAGDGALVRSCLIHIQAPADQPSAPLLMHEIHPDAQMVRLLLGGEDLDARLAPFCAFLPQPELPEELPFTNPTIQRLAVLVTAAQTGAARVRLHFSAEAGMGKRRLAAALARAAESKLLMVDLQRPLAEGVDLSTLAPVLAREAWLHGAVLYLHGMDTLLAGERRAALQDVLEALSALPAVTIFGSSADWPAGSITPQGLLHYALPALEAAQRAACWQKALAGQGLRLPEQEVQRLSALFSLTPLQVDRAAEDGLARMRLLGEQGSLKDHLLEAARAQTRGRLDELAQRVTTFSTWDDLVLPEDTLAQLREICQRAALHGRVLEEWGFGRKLTLGLGVNALFAGASGTGKTMAAGILAGELGLDLYRIDLSGVVSKYIGETEKNLDTIFRAAAGANAVLFFDEADALFGKRSEVRDSHDRYANIEISYLLQRMEEYQGIAILATNLRQNLDEAFTRRLAFTVHFPFPDDDSRLRIWQGIWPADLPVAPEVDFGGLAHQFRLSGGNIKNVALAAAYLAAADGGMVRTAHLLHAMRREFQKMGKPLREDEFSMPAHVEV